MTNATPVNNGRYVPSRRWLRSRRALAIGMTLIAATGLVAAAPAAHADIDHCPIQDAALQFLCTDPPEQGQQIVQLVAYAGSDYSYGDALGIAEAAIAGEASRRGGRCYWSSEKVEKDPTLPAGSSAEGYRYTVRVTVTCAVRR